MNRNRKTQQSRLQLANAIEGPARAALATKATLSNVNATGAKPMENVIGRDPALQRLLDTWNVERVAEVDRIKKEHAGKSIDEMDRHLRLWEKMHPLPTYSTERDIASTKREHYADRDEARLNEPVTRREILDALENVTAQYSVHHHSVFRELLQRLAEALS